MAKHISKGDLRSIGSQRINTLTALSVDAVRNGMNDRARRYVCISLRICGKARIKMPEGFRYCKECLLPMVPGVNSTTRLTGHKVVSTCSCGYIRRIPYLKEQRR